MQKKVTKEIYYQRVQLVMDYMYDHLDEDLSLDKLAEIAFFSTYHFHRIYRSVTGETIAKTMRRLRLQRAAKMLLDTDLSIERIAKKAAHENTDSFIRKFGQEFDLPPNAYRKRGQLMIKESEKTKHDHNNLLYKVEIKMLDKLTLATIDHQGNYMEIGRTFGKLFGFAGHERLMTQQTRCFGIYYDAPGTVLIEKLRSKAGLTVSDNFEEKGEVKKTIIPSIKVAKIIHKGSYSELETAYKWLYESWLLNSGEEPADKPIIEEYLNNPCDVPPSELLTAIHLPLVS